MLGTLERDSVIYVIEGVSERWLKAVLAYEHQGEQIAEGYLREEAIVPEEDQTGTAAAIQSGRYVTCSAYGGIALPLVSFVKTLEEKDEADDTPQDDELAAPARLQHGQNMPEDAAMADAQALSTPLNPAETATVMLTDEDTQVTIDGVPADVRASISVVEADKEVLEAALNETGLTLRNAVCYDSTLWQGETQYQPTDALTVTLPVPLRWGGKGGGKGSTWGEWGAAREWEGGRGCKTSWGVGHNYIFFTLHPCPFSPRKGRERPFFPSTSGGISKKDSRPFSGQIRAVFRKTKKTPIANSRNRH